MSAVAAIDSDDWLLMERDDAIDYLRREHVRVGDAAAARGTNMHLHAEHFATTGEVAPEVTEDSRAYVVNLGKFFAEWKPRVRLSEIAVFSRKDRWAGTMDTILEFPLFPELGVCGVDWKSKQPRDPRRMKARNAHKVGPYPEVAMQLAAYTHGDFYLSPTGDCIPMPHVDRCLAVVVTEDSYTVHEVDGSDATYETFLAAKAIYEFGLAAERKDGGPVGPPMEMPAPMLALVPDDSDPFQGLP